MARALNRTELAAHIAELVKALRQMETWVEEPKNWQTHFCPVCMSFASKSTCYCDYDSDRY